MDKLFGLVSHKPSDSYLRCSGGLSSFYKKNVNKFDSMPGVHHNFCFDYREGDCLPHFCHGGDGLKKYTEKVSLKKLTKFFGKKSMQKWDENIYYINNKS